MDRSRQRGVNGCHEDSEAAARIINSLADQKGERRGVFARRRQGQQGAERLRPTRRVRLCPSGSAAIGQTQVGGGRRQAWYGVDAQVAQQRGAMDEV